MKKIISALAVFLASSSIAMASSLNSSVISNEYVIENSTKQPIALEFYDFLGQWSQPIALHQTIVLQPNQVFDNTLTGENQALFTAIKATIIGQDNKDNGIDFFSGSNPNPQSDTRIVGTGPLRASWTNHCDTKNGTGANYCGLVLKDTVN